MNDSWQYIALLGAIALVIANLMPRRTDAEASKAAQPSANMEIAIEQFMENLEADQREMLQAIQDDRKQRARETKAQGERIAALEEQLKLVRHQLEELQARQQPLAQVKERLVTAPQVPAVSSAYAQSGAGADQDVPVEPVEVQEPSHLLKDRYAEVFALHHRGKSIEAIAKTCRMNKGEVMLILQLAKQEDRHG